MSIYQIYKEKNSGEQCWKWNLLDDKNEIIASSEGFFLKGKIVNSIKEVREEASNAQIWHNGNDKGEYKEYRFEYYQNKKDGKWYWRFRDSNHELMAIGDSYSSEDDVKNILEHIKKEMSVAEITWKNPEDDPTYQDKHDDTTTTEGISGS